MGVGVGVGVVVQLGNRDIGRQPLGRLAAQGDDHLILPPGQKCRFRYRHDCRYRYPVSSARTGTLVLGSSTPSPCTDF